MSKLKTDKKITDEEILKILEQPTSKGSVQEQEQEEEEGGEEGVVRREQLRRVSVRYEACLAAVPGGWIWDGEGQVSNRASGRRIEGGVPVVSR